MEIRPRISICIATYNGLSTVEAAINSAINQSYDNLEILISDDASNDGTWELLQKYQDLEHLSITRNEIRQGRSANYNQLLNLANGEFFLLLDQDDERDSDFVSLAVKEILKSSEVVAVMPRVDVYFKHKLQHINFYMYESSNVLRRIWQYLRDPHDFLPYALLNTNLVKELKGWTSRNSFFHRLSFGLLLKTRVVCLQNSHFKYNAKGAIYRPSQEMELKKNSAIINLKVKKVNRYFEQHVEYSKVTVSDINLRISSKIIILILIWFDFFYKSLLKLISRLLLCFTNNNLPKWIAFPISRVLHPSKNIIFKTNQSDYTSGYYRPNWTLL